MSLIRLNDVSMDFDGRPVLREAFLKLRRGDRIGLIGKNGTGKTTFLELVLGRREPTGGTVDVTLGTTIGYFSQFSELDGEQSTYEMLSAHFTAVHETQARLDEIGAQLAEPMTDAAMTALLVEQGELFERMDYFVEAVFDYSSEYVCRGAVQELKQHQLEGARIVIATGCVVPLAERICRHLGIADVEVVGSTLRRWSYGWVADRHCFGRRKVSMLRERGIERWDAVYTDSAADLPLLTHGVRRYVVNPTPANRKKISDRLGADLLRLAPRHGPVRR